MSANNTDIEKSLWDAADELRTGCCLRAAEYSRPVVGLIFLRDASHRSDQAHQEILVECASGAHRLPPISDANYHELGVLCVPEQARNGYLVQLLEREYIGCATNDAMRALEDHNPRLKDVLPKTYNRLGKDALATLLRILGSIQIDVEGDGIGKTWEYFLGRLAMSQVQRGGEFIPPTSIVRLIAGYITRIRFSCHGLGTPHSGTKAHHKPQAPATHFLLLVTVLLLASLAATFAVEAQPLPPSPFSSASPDSEPQANPTRRVNAPHFVGDVPFSQSAIFWFGQVTPVANYADVRVGYNDSQLVVRVAAFDRRLWYDLSPSPGDLTAWDSVTLFLDMAGNVGAAPAPNAYRFDGQLVWWESPRTRWQAAYWGDGSAWVLASIPFTTTSGWRGDAPNNDVDDRGWQLTYQIPFASLELSGPPPLGTAWGIALALHDRDDALGTPIADQVWPEAMHPQQSVTWGQLAFGMPTFEPQPTVPGGTVLIRQGLDGAVVVDADVGGSSVCGNQAAPEFFPTWGSLNYAGKDFSNVQNQGDVADWPCFAKYYVTFPLDRLPAHEEIVSATLILRQWGHAGEGWDPGPQPSLIQVLTVAQDWSEAALTWNNAPLAVENVAATWSVPLADPGWPGEPRSWDVTRAAAEAYAAGTPLRLALYEGDWAYHSGKYFYTSDNWDESARPTLEIAWGHPLGSIEKTATPRSGRQGDPIAYTLGFLGTGQRLTLTDTLPVGASAPGPITWEGTSVAPVYSAAQHRLTWSDIPPAGQQVAIHYSVNITASNPRALINVANLNETGGGTSTATVTVLANAHTVFTPLIQRSASADSVGP